MSPIPGVANQSEKSEGLRQQQGAGSPQWLSPEHESEWDAFVLSHPQGSLYHTTEWKRVLEQAFPHIRGRFLVLRSQDSRAIQAGLPVYRANSWLLGSRLVSIPFATVCDPLVGAATEWYSLAAELKTECSATRSKKFVLRAALAAGQVPPPFAGSSQFKHHGLQLDPDFDALCRRFDKQSVRQKAEKARKAGVTVEEHSDTAGMAVSHELLATTRRRLSLPPMPARFFESIQQNLRPEHLRIFLAYQKSQTVACHIVLIFKDLWISEYSGNADGAISGVNQLLYLETIRQACAAGAQKFSFGRTSIRNEGLLSYKRRWGTIEENLTDYSLLPDGWQEPQAAGNGSPAEDSGLYALCQRVIAKAPMPVCKLIGDFCYRHLG
jgi:hypothetical protein